MPRARGRSSLEIERLDGRTVRVDRIVVRTVVGCIVRLLVDRVEGPSPQVEGARVPQLAPVDGEHQAGTAAVDPDRAVRGVHPVGAVPVHEVVARVVDRKRVIRAEEVDVSGQRVGVRVDEQKREVVRRGGQIRPGEPEDHLAAGLVSGDVDPGDVSRGAAVAGLVRVGPGGGPGARTSAAIRTATSGPALLNIVYLLSSNTASVQQSPNRALTAAYAPEVRGATNVTFPSNSAFSGP